MEKMRAAKSVKRTYTIGDDVAERFERLVPQGKRSETIERVATRDLVARGFADMADVYTSTSRDWSTADSEGGPTERSSRYGADGPEQAGTRPAITILNERSSVLVVAPITSKKTDPFEALLDHEACGLDIPSKVMLNQIRTVDEAIRLTLGLSEL